MENAVYMELWKKEEKMKEQFFQCPFCGEKILCLGVESEKYMWTKCDHLVYLQLDNKRILYCEDEIINFLQETALPMKFLRDYLNAQSKEDYSVRKVMVNMENIGSLLLFLNYENPVGYCVDGKHALFCNLKNFVMNVLPVKKADINLRCFYTLYFCKENMDENVRNKMFKFESDSDGYTFLSDIPKVFLEKFAEGKAEEIAEIIEMSVEEFKKLPLEERKDFVQEYIVDETFSNPPEVFDFMKKIGLNPEQYRKRACLDEFFIAVEDENLLQKENTDLQRKLTTLGFTQQEAKRRCEYLVETNLAKILGDRWAYFFSIRKILEQLVKKQLETTKREARSIKKAKKVPICEVPRILKREFEKKLEFLVRAKKIEDEVKKDLINVWQKCNKYIHESSHRSPDLVLADAVYCQNIIFHLLKNYVK